MMRMRTLPVILAVIIVSACSTTAPNSATSVGGPSPELAAVSPLFISCPPGATDRMQCLERALFDTLRVEGISAAMATLERVGAADAEIRRDGHVYAHVIGLAAYTTPEEVGTSFAACTPAFQSGCYHGVIQSYFVDVNAGEAGEVTREMVNGLCADYRREGGAWLLFQCAHGMGHGLTMVADYQLPQALESCDLVESVWERDACYGGVFMENIVNAIAPHHTTGRPDQGGGHGHGHQPMAGEQHASDDHASHDDHAAHGSGEADFPPLDPDDLHYPCSALDDRYLEACYTMQTSVALHFLDGDFPAAAEMCSEAPVPYQEACFRSLGRDASSYAVQNHTEGLRLCSAGSPQHQSWCQIGYVKNVIDVTADPSDGIAFCRMVGDGAQKETCYRAVGEQIWVLASNEEERARYCEAAEAAYAAQCRAGASLNTSARLQ